MDWIKRNLVFVIGAAIALGLLGAAGWYSYSGYSTNAEQLAKLDEQYAELKRLKELKPAPGEGKVDNIKLAQEQEKEVQAFLAKFTQRLQRIPALPEGTNLAASDYSAALQRTIDELQREATNASVVLPPRYKFSFEAQAGRVTFAPGSLVPLAAQLGEVKVICEVLNAAKVNALDGVRRERVSADDNSGPATDYLEHKSITNELAISSPYEVTFRCFTPELSAVLTGFANSPYGLIVKAMNVETSTAPVLDAYSASAPVVGVPVPVYAPQPEMRRMDESEAFRSRYGRRGPTPPPPPTPTPMPVPVAVGVAPPRGGLQTFLTEKQLKVTMLIHVVKLLPPPS